MERSTLNKLLDMPDFEAYIELARLHLIMNEYEWQELCDEYAIALAEKNLN